MIIGVDVGNCLVSVSYSALRIYVVIHIYLNIGIHAFIFVCVFVCFLFVCLTFPILTEFADARSPLSHSPSLSYSLLLARSPFFLSAFLEYADLKNRQLMQTIAAMKVVGAGE